jgi:hypothetical protein
MKSRSLAVFLGAFAAVISGCGATDFDDALPATLEDVNAIRNDGALEPWEKRSDLAALGFDEVTINGLLAGERLGNQFGGTLSTALDKVVAERFTELTPDEVQLYGDATDQSTYSDDEAQAIVWLFGDYDINTPDELQAFVDDPASQVPDEVDEEILVEVFINTDPDDVRAELP